MKFMSDKESKKAFPSPHGDMLHPLETDNMTQAELFPPPRGDMLHLVS